MSVETAGGSETQGGSPWLVNTAAGQRALPPLSQQDQITETPVLIPSSTEVQWFQYDANPEISGPVSPASQTMAPLSPETFSYNSM